MCKRVTIHNAGRHRFIVLEAQVQLGHVGAHLVSVVMPSSEKSAWWLKLGKGNENHRIYHYGRLTLWFMLVYMFNKSTINHRIHLNF